jgi:hypothetical protein
MSLVRFVGNMLLLVLLAVACAALVWFPIWVVIIVAWLSEGHP